MAQENSSTIFLNFCNFALKNNSRARSLQAAKSGSSSHEGMLRKTSKNSVQKAESCHLREKENVSGFPV